MSVTYTWQGLLQDHNGSLDLYPSPGEVVWEDHQIRNGNVHYHRAHCLAVGMVTPSLCGVRASGRESVVGYVSIRALYAMNSEESR